MNKRWYFALLAAVVFIIVAVCVFAYTYPTHYPFNDRLIVGATRDEIVARYGEFWCEDVNIDGTLCRGRYMIRDNTPEMIMGYDNSLWYEIYFTDEIATRVELRRGYIGG